jgi:hypothetical protein
LDGLSCPFRETRGGGASDVRGGRSGRRDIVMRRSRQGGPYG